MLRRGLVQSGSLAVAIWLEIHTHHLFSVIAPEGDKITAVIVSRQSMTRNGISSLYFPLQLNMRHNQ